jgi:hypothetical protein
MFDMYVYYMAWNGKTVGIWKNVKESEFRGTLTRFGLCTARMQTAEVPRGCVEYGEQIPFLRNTNTIRVLSRCTVASIYINTHTHIYAVYSQLSGWRIIRARL